MVVSPSLSSTRLLLGKVCRVRPWLLGRLDDQLPPTGSLPHTSARKAPVPTWPLTLTYLDADR